jgi:hypothetical protein
MNDEVGWFERGVKIDDIGGMATLKTKTATHI